MTGVLGLGLAISCGSGASDGDAGARAADGGGIDAAGAERMRAILTAEHRRSAGEITPADQQARDVRIRRAAARALARIGGEASRGGLLRALADEDDEVNAWGAYGLGSSCEGGKGNPKETVAALVAQLLARVSEGRASLAGDSGVTASASASAGPPPPEANLSRLDPVAAASRAIGRCAADESEPTLVAWLAMPRDRAVAAAWGLGDIAVVKKKLREETVVALLALAAGSAASPPVPEALFPIGRLENVPLTAVDRIREVATARLAERGEARLFAVRALGRGGLDAVPELGRVLSSPAEFTPAERAEAARGLKRSPKAGAAALAAALPALTPASDPIALSGLVGDEVGVLLATLEALDGAAADPAAQKALRALATLAPPPNAPAAILRRIAWIRCSAARVLAGANFRDPLLMECDVSAMRGVAADADAGAPPADAGGAQDGGAASADGGAPAPAPASRDVLLATIGARAQIAVIGRGEIVGPRAAAWRFYATAGELRARQAAIELVESHPEIERAAEVLAMALVDERDGVAATAAEVIAKQPQRAEDAGRRPKKGKRKRDSGDAGGADAVVGVPSPAVVKALLEVLRRAASRGDPELLGSVVDAVAALALKDAIPTVEELCRSSWPTLRTHAAKALDALSGKKGQLCDAPPGGGDAPAELSSLVTAPVTLELDTDVGALTLAFDPSLAPVTATRVVQLARAGYYDGMVVHRVVPGFVTQFGAPAGDGYGGPPDKPPLRCETSPLPFSALTVGVALAGRDTGSSQLFVMQGRYPHLEGGYAWVGRATGPWASFVDGDRIRKVTVVP